MKLFTDAQLDELYLKATTSPRRRAHHVLHASHADPVQRFFVSACEDAYFRPHKHLTKGELAIALRGRFDIITFDDDARVQGRYALGAGAPNFAYETPPGTWHTLIAQSEECAFFEVKQGPYDPAVAVDFAPWAPAEGDARVPQLVSWLRTAEPGSIFEG